MSEPIVYIDSSAIREDKLEQVKAAIKEWVEFIEAKELGKSGTVLHKPHAGFARFGSR